MEAKANIELVDELQRAAREQDFDHYRELLADDAVFRMAGVPAALGGVTTGADAIVQQMRQNAGVGRLDVKNIFGDDEQVCVIGKVSADRFIGNDFLKAKDLPYSTYECVVYRIADGKVAESTAYINWLDPYVQVGLVDASMLTR